MQQKNVAESRTAGEGSREDTEMRQPGASPNVLLLGPSASIHSLTYSEWDGAWQVVKLNVNVA